MDGYVHVVPVVREGLILFLKTIYPSRKGDQETQERRARMRRRGFHDDEEKDLITAYESGEFRPVKDQKLVFGERQLRNRSAPGHLRTRLQKHPEPGV